MLSLVMFSEAFMPWPLAHGSVFADVHGRKESGP
jgi:hypothetical protein